MPVKLIALDLDGTLVDNSHVQIPDRNIEALRHCAANGIHVVLASGRPFATMTGPAGELGCVRYMISANGSAVWDLEKNEPLVTRHIPVEQSQKILDILLYYPIATEVYCDGHAYVDRHTWLLENYDLQPASFVNFRAQHNITVDNLKESVIGKPVEKFNVDNMPHSVRDQVLERLKPFQDDLAINYIECYRNMEISRADATKGLALADLCQLLGIAADDVLAFGDSDNDVAMLQWAGHSYAMANGEQAAKIAAKSLTSSNQDAGVAHALISEGLFIP